MHQKDILWDRRDRELSIPSPLRSRSRQDHYVNDKEEKDKNVNRVKASNAKEKKIANIDPRQPRSQGIQVTVAQNKTTQCKEEINAKESHSGNRKRFGR
jgi:homoaconitase/3-isopropylmalate dehydratase large subunit